MKKERSRNANYDREDREELLQVDDLWEKINIEKLIDKEFQKDGVKPLEVLSVKGLSDAAVRFIEYGDKEKLGQIIELRMVTGSRRSLYLSLLNFLF